jgi:CheY-like chemotaxis protein
MPNMDGMMLAREIRAFRSAQILPLVMFTSLGRREMDLDTVNFSAFLSKPIKPSQLFDTLAAIFGDTSPGLRGVDGHSAVQNQTSVKPQTDMEMGIKHPLRILLAEDNPVNQKLALRILQQMGYRANVAANGLEALEAVAGQMYDVVLMDVQMPEMDGLEASRQICARWSREARPRIIAMTANAMQGDRETCISAGMDDYITKPIRVNELVESLEKVNSRQ